MGALEKILKVEIGVNINDSKNSSHTTSGCSGLFLWCSTLKNIRKVAFWPKIDIFDCYARPCSGRVMKFRMRVEDLVTNIDKNFQLKVSHSSQNMGDPGSSRQD